MKLRLAEAIAAHVAARSSVVLATRLSDGREYLGSDPELPPGLSEACRAALDAGRSGSVDVAGGSFFLHVFAPELRLLLVGAVHVAQILAPIASRTGFQVRVIDPRRHYITPERFTDIALIPAWPDNKQVVDMMDSRTALVTLSHDPKIDDPALEAAIKAGCFYIGSLGSRKTQLERLQRLRERGVPEDGLKQIRGPVGLPLGSSSASAIAVSVLAEIIAVANAAPIASR